MEDVTKAKTIPYSTEYTCLDKDTYTFSLLGYPDDILEDAANEQSHCFASCQPSPKSLKHLLC